MLKIIADLFASEPTARRATAFRPQLTAMEERYAPAMIVTSNPTATSAWQHPGDIRGFNPQPEPPAWLGG